MVDAHTKGMNHFRCRDCEEWVTTPEHKGSWNKCSCQQLYVKKVSNGSHVHGMYIAFWNSISDKHIEYDFPRGL